MILFVLGPILFGLFFYICKCKVLLPVTLIFETLLASSSFMILINYKTERLMPLLGFNLPVGMALRIDQLSAMMLLLNNLLFVLMILFNINKSYMNKLFIFLFLSLQSLINGIFLSTDFFNIYILVEVATIVVSILIMYKKDSQSMYDGMIYLLVNMVAMTFFLFGVGYLYKMAGALDFYSIKSAISKVDNPYGLIIPCAFLLTGVSLKAALMPLFSWLPKAHGTASAPSIVSGVLSGIFVKTGVYLFLRIIWIFNTSISVTSLFLWMGFITAIAGFIFAFSQTDIKLILAYHTISQIGLIMIGLNSVDSSGGLYHIFAHGIFKTLLFLIAGVLVEIYKTRKIEEMHGLFYHSKALSLLLIVAVLSITGAPLFSGGYSKYYITANYHSLLFDFLFLLINVGTMMSFIKFLKVLLPSKDQNSHSVHLNIRPNVFIALGSLAAICIVLGVFGDAFMLLFTGQRGHYDYLSQLIKIPKYLFTYALSGILYFFIKKKHRLLKIFSGLDLSFNQITLAITSFFFVTMIYLHLVLRK